jgi:hypothetical protein
MRGNAVEQSRHACWDTANTEKPGSRRVSDKGTIALF